MAEYSKYEPIFGAWKVTGLIGEGNYGRVYKIERKDFGLTYQAALKFITYPKNDSEVMSLRADGMDDESIKRCMYGFVKNVGREFAIMSRLKGNSNIVSYEDHAVMPHDTGIGWDIMIRMELLTNLVDYMAAHRMTKRDTIRLGIDMCRALELCQKHNIIHRDIKPENIFISENGDYKLGDFGIARRIESTMSGLSKKGTYTYMAPEVYKGEPYGSTVDIYSLGIVMYRLLNNYRAPFFPEHPHIVTEESREKALIMRMSGKPLPPPKDADGRLAEIVLKAASYDEKDRYRSPRELRLDLEDISYTDREARIIYPMGDDLDIKSLHYASGEDSEAPTEPMAEEEPVAKKQAPSHKKRRGILIAAIAAAAVGAAVLVLPALKPPAIKASENTAGAVVTEAAANTLPSTTSAEMSKGLPKDSVIMTSTADISGLSAKLDGSSANISWNVPGSGGTTLLIYGGDTGLDDGAAFGYMSAASSNGEAFDPAEISLPEGMHAIVQGGGTSAAVIDVSAMEGKKSLDIFAVYEKKTASGATLKSASAAYVSCDISALWEPKASSDIAVDKLSARSSSKSAASLSWTFGGATKGDVCEYILLCGKKASGLAPAYSSDGGFTALKAAAEKAGYRAITGKADGGADASAEVSGLSAGEKYVFEVAYAKNGKIFSAAYARTECTTKKAATQKNNSSSKDGGSDMTAPVIW